MESTSTAEMPEEVQSLCQLFTDIDPQVVLRVYMENDQDMKATMQILAEMAKDPSLQHSQQAKPAPAKTEILTAIGISGHVGSAFAAPTAPSASPRPSHGHHDDEEPPEDDNNIWDPTSFSSTMATVGTSVTTGLTQLAASVSDWVADLASAFDSGWGDDDEEEAMDDPKKRDIEPSVAHGGIDSERLTRRGKPHGSSGALAYTDSRRQTREEEEEELDDDDDDYKKDA